MSIRKLATATLAAGALVAAPVLGVSGPASAATTTGCPVGYVCVYPSADWNGGVPSLKFYTRGVHVLANRYGVHRIFNNWPDARVYFCKGIGTQCDSYLASGTYADKGFTTFESLLIE